MISIFTLMLGAMGLGQAFNDLADQKQGLLAAKRIFQTIENGKKSPIDGLSTTGVIPEQTSRGQITLSHICFHYPTRTNVEVCQDYNLTIESGEVVALVGPSGSGKVSYCLQLFCDAYEHIL